MLHSTREGICVVVAIWDNVAKVWVAQSNDVPGLCIEAASQPELESRLKVAIPELLRLNHVSDDCVPVEFELLLRGQSHIEMAS